MIKSSPNIFCNKIAQSYVSLNWQKDLTEKLKRIHRPILLKSVPGTGKTFFVASYAEALNATFFRINLSDDSSAISGDSERSHQDEIVHVLEVAKSLSGHVVVLFDEADAVLQSLYGNPDFADMYVSAKMAMMVFLENVPSNVSVFIASNADLEPIIESRCYIVRPHLGISDFASVAKVLWECDTQEASQFAQHLELAKVGDLRRVFNLKSVYPDNLPTKDEMVTYSQSIFSKSLPPGFLA